MLDTWSSNKMYIQALLEKNVEPFVDMPGVVEPGHMAWSLFS